MRNEYDKEYSTKLRDVDEELRIRLIIPLLEKADSFFIINKYEQQYRCLRNIFNYVRPNSFDIKGELQQMTEIIDEYIENLGGQPADAGQLIEMNNLKIQFKELVKKYSELIPYALKELGLYFRLVSNKNDDDEIFNEKTFTLKQSYIKEKIDEMSNKLTTREILEKHLTSRQINDVYSRYLIKNGLPRENIERG